MTSGFLSIFRGAAWWIPNRLVPLRFPDIRIVSWTRIQIIISDMACHWYIKQTLLAIDFEVPLTRTSVVIISLSTIRKIYIIGRLFTGRKVRFQTPIVYGTFSLYTSRPLAIGLIRGLIWNIDHRAWQPPMRVIVNPSSRKKGSFAFPPW